MNHRQILWAARRGMLELDILLGAFAQWQYPDLAAETQQLFQQFLAEQDQDLFNWLLKKSRPENSAYLPLIEAILDSNQLSIVQ